MPLPYKPLQVKIGAVDPGSARQFVIGRDQLVESFWKNVASSSLRVLAERRMGKTWVMNLALASVPSNAVAAMFDAEGADTAPRFIVQLNQCLHSKGLIPDTWKARVADWFRRTLQRVQGQPIGPYTVPEDLDPWEALLADTCRQAARGAVQGHAVLIIDELPFFLDNLIKAGRTEEAIRFLDTLRAMRHELPSLRMIFCGSLELHIVLDKLRATGYVGSPVNDMRPFSVPPLEQADAAYLAGCLLTGSVVECTDIGEVAASVAKASSGVPFYVQNIVSWMADHDRSAWTPEAASNVPYQLYDDPADPAQFQYYDARLSQYYPDDIVEKARAALDAICREPAGLSFEKVLNGVRHDPKTLTTDETQLRKVLDILCQDHYVFQCENGWQFKCDIVRRWWCHRCGGRSV